MSLVQTIYDNFVFAGRDKLFINGLLVTLEITFFSAALGIALGFLVSSMKLSDFKIWKFKPFSFVAEIYITVVRGTPTVVQLLIMFYYILANPIFPKKLVAIITFGVNSGAYVAEIFRAGILSVERGQIEAGLSLGFSKAKTMAYIVMPQAIKNVIPALCNEFVVLIKETAVVGYIALADLTKVGETVRGRTFSVVTLFGVALVYLFLTFVLSRLIKILERKLRSSDMG